ncbi:sodium:solute symporter family protein [Limnochorda pilosa]|uniref:Sodium:solute symporter n=1 Tax=Limnochorda pilosa TaxID=1555112 RepID=A0A0K2SFR0_LIMPI|nr:sodium:solute symporter family protein [Limnochorda pilosa]BAS25930.1 sodium:solute symporter [Limnochorda pilosa]
MVTPQAWVWTFVGAYWLYCIYWGIKGALQAKTASGYMIAGRQLPMWIFILAATATSFSGWTFVGHPGLIWKDGMAYAFASFYVLTIPITGAFFAKRQWLLGKRYGFITPGDMYSYYYGTEAMRVLVVVVAFLYSAFYSAVQLLASGSLFHWVTGIPVMEGAMLLAAIVVFYVAAGGLRSIAAVDALQAILLVAGIITLGAFVLDALGGWAVFSSQLRTVEARYLQIPAVMKVTAGEQIWTGTMILTYMFSLMGIQSSPAFTMWSFSNKNPRPFPWQQTFASTFVVGFALFFFTAIQGMGGRLVGADVLGIRTDADLVPALMTRYLPPIALAFVTIGALAAMQSTASPYIGTGSTILSRDVYFRYIRPNAGHREQIWTARVFAVIIVVVAFVIAVTNQSALVMLGGLATAFGTLMYLPLLGVVYGLRVTGLGTVLGLIAGIAAVFLTDILVPGWKYPLTIHSAGWGLGIAIVVGLLASLLGKESEESIARRREVREWLDSVDGPTESQKKWRKAMWVVVPVWYIFAIGPGAVLGNNAFSFLGFPPLWSWQIAWWLVGIAMMWALTFKAGLSLTTDEQIARAEKETRYVVHEVAPEATVGVAVTRS